MSDVDLLLSKIDDLAAAVARLERRVAQSAAELLTPAQAAVALSVSTKTVRKMVADGRLRSVPMGKRWRVPMSEVRRLSTPKETSKTRRLPAAPYDAKAEAEAIRRGAGGRR